jgi:hypothetical protein
VTIDVPHEYLPLIIKALDNQYAASQVFNRQDYRHRDISRLFSIAVERKGAEREKDMTHKRRRKG